MRIWTTACTIVLVSGLTACLSFEDEVIHEDSIGETQEELLTLNLLTLNGISENTLALDSDNADLLKNNKLVDLRWAFFTDLQYSANREFIKYMVGCALPAGESVQFVRKYGTRARTLTYYGEVGLAPQWRDTASCNQSCQEKVTGCLIDRVNYKGIEVPISLRVYGQSTPNLEKFQYYKAEGAGYGNIFAPGSPMYWCSMMTTEHEQEYIGWHRWCGASYQYADQCGDAIKYTGPCNDLFSSARACYLDYGQAGYSPSAGAYYPDSYAWCQGDHGDWYTYAVASHRHYAY